MGPRFYDERLPDQGAGRANQRDPHESRGEPRIASTRKSGIRLSFVTRDLTIIRPQTSPYRLVPMISRITLCVVLCAGVAAAQRPARILPIRPASQIHALTPSQGPISGGTIVTISGASFTDAAVRVDGQVVKPLAQSDTAITLQMAPHDNGYVVVSVTAADGTSVYGRYLYVPPRLDELPQGYITTVAGVGNFKGDFGPASEATVHPTNLAFDPFGNLYVAEPEFYEVTRIRPDGVIERFAGSGAVPDGQSIGPSCCGDGGPAAQAQIEFPRGVTVDKYGNVFIADHNFRIRRVDGATATISTIAGMGVRGFSGDGGPAASARIGLPAYITTNGVDLFFVDFNNARIRRIDSLGIISTVAGDGRTGFGGDGGPATEASFNFTASSDDGGLALDTDGNLFVIDVGNARIRRIDAATRQISTFTQFNRIDHPEAIATDRDGNVYYSSEARILKLSPSGAVIRTWGMQPGDLSPDGTSLDQMRFGYVNGITFDAAGNLVYGDQAAGRVRRMNFATNAVETIAGSAPATIGEDGPAVAAALLFHNGGDVVSTPSGDLLIADSRVRRLTADGLLRTIAGHALHVPAQSNLDNVPALNIWNGAMSLFVGPTDEIDTVSFMSVPYHIDRAGIAHRLAAAPGEDCGYTGDGGPSVRAQLCQPWDIVRDRAGNAFIADTNNNRIRRIDAATGVITTVAGGGGPVNGYENYLHGSYCGDGGPAVNACLNTPYSLAFDGDGNLFVSDHGNNRIRQIDRAGIITTFVEIVGVTSIRFDRNGNLYTNTLDRIVRFDRRGNMTTVAGTRDKTGFSGDGGPALNATLDGKYGQSRGMAFNDQGDLFFVDFANRRVRAVRGGAR